MTVINKHSLLILVGLLSVILFDAIQQKYYLDTFDIYTDTPPTVWDLFFSHFIRWTVWGLLSILYAVTSFRLLNYSGNEVSLTTWVMISIITISSNLLSLVLISLLSLVTNQLEVTFTSFWENLVFFTFQKGLSFMFASSLLILLVYNRAKGLIINAQLVQINALQNESSKEKKSLSIKTGRKISIVPLSDIFWIEAYDYCVKVHTPKKTYTMRNSLKSLQKELKNQDFIRIHRKALINLNYIEQVNYDSSTVILKNESEINLSKNGVKELKEIFTAQSI